jgi:phosphatidylglycerophosphatase A
VIRAVGVSVATCGFVGYAPIAPGTAGSLAALMLWGGVRAFGGDATELWLLGIVVAVGVWAASVSERHFQKTDPGTVVIDEVAGMLLTLLWLPVSWVGVLAGFFAFRIFDIVKPFPARAAERLPGGWGIMVDDLVAGVYAHLVVRLLGWALPSLVML